MRDQPAVRLRQHHGRQPGDRGRRAREAQALRGGGARHLGLGIPPTGAMRMRAILGCAYFLCTRAGRAEDPLATRSGWEVGGQLSTYHYEEPAFHVARGQPIRGERRLHAVERRSARSRASRGAGPTASSNTRARARSTACPINMLEVRMLAGRDYGAASVALVALRRAAATATSTTTCAASPLPARSATGASPSTSTFRSA